MITNCNTDAVTNNPVPVFTPATLRANSPYSNDDNFTPFITTYPFLLNFHDLFQLFIVSIVLFTAFTVPVPSGIYGRPP